MKHYKLVLTSTLPSILVILYISANSSDTIPKSRDPSTKTILIWNAMFESPDHYFGGFGSEIFSKCVYNNCRTTNNKNELPISEFDAIIFHGYEYNTKYYDKPLERSENQIYIFSDLEAPINNPEFVKKYRDLYNWSMTYQLNSDLPRPYGGFSKVDGSNSNYKALTREIVKKKSRKIAWLVSDCHTKSHREEIVKNLAELIEIDIYGKCGDLSCPKSSAKQCYEMIEAKYKFYLAFENTICHDYVTEKFFNIMEYNIIPIVYGGANYSAIAPENSFIDILNFTSIRDFVGYLNYLDSNDEEYLKYFEWKRTYIRTFTVNNMICDLCRKLNQERRPKTYDLMKSFWTNQCWLPDITKFTIK